MLGTPRDACRMCLLSLSSLGYFSRYLLSAVGLASAKDVSVRDDAIEEYRIRKEGP